MPVLSAGSSSRPPSELLGGRHGGGFFFPTDDITAPSGGVARDGPPLLARPLARDAMGPIWLCARMGARTSGLKTCATPRDVQRPCAGDDK